MELKEKVARATAAVLTLSKCNLELLRAELLRGKSCRDVTQRFDSLIQRRKAGIIRLTSMVAIEDLLQHDSQLKHREHFIEANICEIGARPLGVTLDYLFTRRPSRSSGDSRK